MNDELKTLLVTEAIKSPEFHKQLASIVASDNSLIMPILNQIDTDLLAKQIANKLLDGIDLPSGNRIPSSVRSTYTTILKEAKHKAATELSERIAKEVETV